MFDTFAVLFAGFTGKLKDHREARKLVWLLLITFLFGWLTTLFAAWISYPSYRSLIDYLAYADHIAMFFTGGVAGFIYFSLMYITGYAVEIWKKVPASQRNYNVLGARIIGLSCVFFLVIDFLMNLSGVGYRATAAAGPVAVYEYQMPAKDRADLDKYQKDLEDIYSLKNTHYTWFDERGKPHLNASGTTTTKNLQKQIQAIQYADSVNRAQFIADKEAANTARTNIEAKAARNLKGGVYGVYILLLLIGFVSAYIVETIQQAMTRPQPAHNQQRANGTYQNLTNTPIVPGGGNSSLVNSIQAEPVAIPTAEPLRVVGGWEITCQHCGQKAIKSRPAIWCGAACKTAAYEARTGKTLKRVPVSARMTPIGFK